MIGRTLAHYRVLERLGSGGMGVVYAAEDTKLSRRVALKVLPAERDDASALSRFEREAKAVAALNHPNIVQVYSVEEAEGVHFITMELVRGKTLAELLPRSGLALERFFELALPLTDALAQAHRAGIVHRDLKPANVMVSDEGRVKILDFGLAKAERSFAATALESDVSTLARTEDGEILGTVAYMSPEQAEGKPLDARSDIFSLGILLYEALSGRRPFGGDSPTAILSSILKDAPAPLREHRPEIPRDLIRIVHRCLEKDPNRRIQTATDVHNELEEVKRDLDSGQLQNESRASSRSSSRKRTFLWAFAALLVLVAALALLVRPSREVGFPRLTRPVQVTSAGGVETRPTWSPDGGRIAFESDQGENSDIWVAQIGSGVPVNLTADSPRNDRYPRWSPDGSHIAIASGRDTFVVPAVGGTARKVHSAEDLVLSRGSS